jgi:hypothetical protein
MRSRHPRRQGEACPATLEVGHGMIEREREREREREKCMHRQEEVQFGDIEEGDPMI